MPVARKRERSEPRRARAASAEKRARLLDATEDIILREGYAAVSSRNVAAGAGIQAPLLHYYFPTIDDLFVAVLRRRAERNVERMAAALGSGAPLRAWWDLAADPRGAALFVELMAAANHRPALRAEVGEVARAIRHMQMRTLLPLLGEYGLDADQLPPALIAAAMHGLAFGLVADEVAGYDTAHAEARAAMTRLLERLESRRRPKRNRVGGRSEGAERSTSRPDPPHERDGRTASPARRDRTSRA
jgi:AcrR family transcriptional regulator